MKSYKEICNRAYVLT